jgi:hypothetical protein
MEYKAAFVVLLVELIAGIAVFVYWLRRESDFNHARNEFAEFLKLHLVEGTLLQQLEDIAEGRLSVCQRKRSLKIYLWLGISGALGVAVIFLVARFTPAGIIIRTIIGSLSILPFIYFVSIAIAEEFDDNRISRFERNTSRLLLLRSQDGTIANEIDEMFEQCQSLPI